MRAQDALTFAARSARAPSLVGTAGADHCASRELRLAAFAGGEGSASSLVYRSRTMGRALCTQSPVSHVIGTHESGPARWVPLGTRLVRSSSSGHARPRSHVRNPSRLALVTFSSPAKGVL